MVLPWKMKVKKCLSRRKRKEKARLWLARRYAHPISATRILCMNFNISRFLSGKLIYSEKRGYVQPQRTSIFRILASDLAQHVVFVFGEMLKCVHVALADHLPGLEHFQQHIDAYLLLRKHKTHQPMLRR